MKECCGPHSTRITACTLRSISDANFAASFKYACMSLDRIYPGNFVTWKTAGPSYHLLKIFEEVGELHEAATALAHGKVKKVAVVASEFADLMAWLLSAWDICFPGIEFDKAFISYYAEGCPVCGELPCVCKPYADRRQAVPNYELIAPLIKQLEDLKAELGARGNSLESVTRSLTVAQSTESDATTKQAVNQAKRALDSISSGAEKGSKVLDLVETAMRMLGSIFG